jgi:tetraacyldisaccharide 4'-kinase
MHFFSRLFLRAWYSGRPTWLSVVLLPFALLYGIAVEIRASLYRCGFRRVEELAVPVIVVGNITVGGTGKTPFVIALARALAERGFSPGIISRGYGGRSSRPERVTPQTEASEVGDEAIEIAARTGMPVVVGRDRPAAGRHLLMHFPDTNVVISDDGLQHYRLGRTVEIGMVDGKRGLGNGWPLPAGPLRERVSRLRQTTALVLTGGKDFTPRANRFHALQHMPAFCQRLEPVAFYQVGSPEHARSLDAFAGEQNVVAVAGIGNPQRFFDTLGALNISFTAHDFADHHEFTADDLDFEGARWILMTEKDAVKCRAFADERCWFLRVKSEIPEELLKLIERKLKEA